MPLRVFGLNILHNFASFLLNCQIILVSPLLKVAQLIIPTDFHESIINFCFASDPEVIGLLFPLEEKREELFAHHGSHDKTCLELAL
jgi:hypothetical protein